MPPISCVGLTIELKTIKRQSDPKFISILNELRFGRCSPTSSAVLKRTKSNWSERTDGVLATKLCTHSDDAANINREELLALPGDAIEFRAVDSEQAMKTFLDRHTPVDAMLCLKVRPRFLVR